MPTEILDQLKSLREGIADKLKKDPRYLTLTALDKSIAEISGVLVASGLIPAEHAGAPAPLHFTPDAVAGRPAAGPVAETQAAAPSASRAASAENAMAENAIPASVAPAPAAASSAEAVQKKKKKSVLKPVLETAAIVGAAALAAEIYSEVKGTPSAKAAAKPAAAAGKSEPAAPIDPVAHEASGDDEDDSPTDHVHSGSEHDAADDGEAAPASGEDKQAHDGPAGAEHAEHAEDEHAGTEHEEAGEAEHEAAEDGAAAIPKGKASGYKAMAAKPDATQYQPAMSVKFGRLPNKVDLRPLMTPVEDQGDTNSCVANAVAGAYEYWIKKASKQDQNISRLFVYYNARWRDGSQDKDAGSVIQLAMEGLSKFGACSEKVWPFDTHLTLKKPGAEAYKDAAAYRVQDMAQVPLKLEAWKQALAEGKPIVFGCALFDSFDQCSQRGGVVPMPAPEDLARDKHSGHSMCAVGYSDTEKVFIVRNSWGADWGNKGYCYMPYSYLMNPKFNDGDCWVFVPKVPAQPPREVWSDTSDPVTNDGKGVDFEIETYKISDYEHIAIDLFEEIRHPFNTTILSDYSQYVSWAGRSMWSELSTFDVATYLASAAALTGVASIAAAAYLSETSTSETSLSESSETLSAMSEEDSEETSDEDESEDTDEDDSDEDESEDEDAEDDDAEESEDGDDAEDDDSEDDDAEESEDGDDAEDDDSEDDDAEESEDGDDAEDDDSEDDDADESEDDAEDEDSEDDASDEDDEDEAEDDDDADGDDSEGDESGDDE